MLCTCTYICIQLQPTNELQIHVHVQCTLHRDAKVQCMGQLSEEKAMQISDL